MVLDGRPVLVLCSGNSLGLADHPRVREAAADAAMRWGVGAGAARAASGTMTLHRRLEERLARFMRCDAGVVFGSGSLANLGVIPALARKGEVVFHDELAHNSIADGCRLAGADAFAYRHCDPEHLAWGLQQADGRGALIATDGVFGLDGDVAPLEEIVALARRYDVRVLVDEAQAIGAIGPGGRGAVAEAGLEEEIDIVTGSLGKALGSYGGFACCDHVTARFLVNSRAHAAALDGAAAGRGRRRDGGTRAAGGAASPRREAARQRRDAARRAGPRGLRGRRREHAHRAAAGRRDRARRAIVEYALEQGVFCESATPAGASDGGAARLRLAVMASHTRAELRGAARVLARSALRAGVRPGSSGPVALAQLDELPRAA